jgi:hypothetical protein
MIAIIDQPESFGPCPVIGCPWRRAGRSLALSAAVVGFIKDGGGAQQVIEKNRIRELFHIQKCFNSWKK